MAGWLRKYWRVLVVLVSKVCRTPTKFVSETFTCETFLQVHHRLLHKYSLRNFVFENLKALSNDMTKRFETFMCMLALTHRLLTTKETASVKTHGVCYLHVVVSL